MNYITGVNCLLRMSLHAGKIGEWHLIETIYNIYPYHKMLYFIQQKYISQMQQTLSMYKKIYSQISMHNYTYNLMYNVCFLTYTKACSKCTRSIFSIVKYGILTMKIRTTAQCIHKPQFLRDILKIINKPFCIISQAF